MSEREQLQNEIYDYLCSKSSVFTAPYGILKGEQKLPRGGKVRNITFGIARYLDAHLIIWTPKDLTLDATGGLDYKLKHKYTSWTDLKTDLDKFI